MEALLNSGWTKVRAELDLDKLCNYLNASGIRLEAFDPKSVIVLQSNNGMSNPTFYLQQSASSREPALIIRKKPPGKLLPGAHQIEREFRAMKHLADTAVPVPRVHVLCSDESILGQAFYVMDYVSGPVPNDPGLPGLAPNSRAKIFAHAIQILATLHSLDYVALGLQKHGRAGNYAARQLRTWSRQYELGDALLSKYQQGREKQIAAAASQLTVIGAAKRLDGNVTHDDAKDRLVAKVLSAGADMRKLIALLTEQQKGGRGGKDETTLVHGDFRMGNFILDVKAGRIAAVLDWEISTLGHPLLDLAYLVSPYYAVGEGGFQKDPKTNKGGLPPGAPTLQEVLRMYCEARGLGPIPQDAWNFWVALNCFRTAAIVHGVFARYIGGNAGSTNASYAGGSFLVEVQKGLKLLRAASGTTKSNAAQRAKL